MALRNSASAVALVMVGLVVVGNVLRGARDRDEVAAPAGQTVAAANKAPEAAPKPPAAAELSPPVAPLAVATPDVDRDLPTGAIEADSGLQRPNPAAYGDAAKAGSSLIITGAEAINYLAGNTLKRQGADGSPRYSYFAPRGVVTDGTEREFVARAWDRNAAAVCEPASDGAPNCRPIEIMLDAKEELQGGRLGSVRLGTETAELIKGNVLRVPQHIPFIDSTVATEAALPPQDPASAGSAELADRTAAITPETDRGRRFVYYAADNRLLDVQPIESGPSRAVRVAVGHWRFAKGVLCETRTETGAAQVCYTSQPLAGGAMRLVPVAKSGQALRAVLLPETRVRAVAED